MASISTTIQITDRLTPVLKNINSAMYKTLTVFDDVDNKLNTSFDSKAVTSARIAIDQAKASINNFSNGTNDVASNVDKLNSKLSKGTSLTKSFTLALAGISVAKKVLNVVVGQLDSAMKRMDTMTNFKKTMTAITGSESSAKASLNQLKDMTKGTAYGLDTAAKSVQNFTTRGLAIKNATNEVGKWADAVSFYGDGTNEQLSSVTDALGKMLSKGTVEMDQLNRLTDAGINAVGMYAQATGKSSGSVQKALSSGKISSYDFITTVSTAFEEGTNGVLKIEGAAKEAGATWATTIANAKAAVTRGLVSLVENIDNGLQNAGLSSTMTSVKNLGEGVENLLNKIGRGVSIIITVLSPLIKAAKSFGSFIANNWSIISPIIWGIVAALVAYHGAQLALNTVNAIAAGIEAAKTLAHTTQAAALAMQTGATFAATAAQYGFNAALWACPITWIVAGIILLIAALYMVVALINKVKGTSISATGVILGAIMSFIAFIWNRSLALLDVVLGIINYCANNFLAFANFLGNLFRDPIASIIHLFGDMADNILSIIETVAKALDKVFGSDLAGAVSGWRNGLDSMIEKAADKYGNGTYEATEKLNLNSESLGLKRWAYKDAYNFGYNLGDKFDKKIGNMFSSKGDENGALDKMQDQVDKIANNTGDINKKLDVTEEDLKYLRDLAEQEVINRFTTAEIHVDMGGITNNVSSNTDLDGIVSYLTESVETAMEETARGV